MEYDKFYPLHKEYKFSRIKFERVFRKMGRHEIYFLRRVKALCDDLNLINNRIKDLMDTPFTRVPGFINTYKTLFPGHQNDRESLPEFKQLEDLYKNFRNTINKFLTTNKEYYARQKSPKHPSDD